MSVRLEDDVIHLNGSCGIADVEPLLALLQSPPGRCVDLSDVGHLHAAVFQLLLAFRPAPAGVQGAEPPGLPFCQPSRGSSTPMTVGITT